MPCANCGKTYEEHASGLAYCDFTGAGMECGGYVDGEPLALLPPECHFCGASECDGPLKEYDDSSPNDCYVGVIHACAICRKEHHLDD